MRILIVDDEMVSRTKLETLMAPIGDCQTTDCGASAVSLYQQTHSVDKGFDLVMLDIDMPDMQGQEVLQQLRKIENFGPHRAAIVMVTAQSDQKHVVTCLKNGCDAYIAKPFNAEIINKKLVELGLLNADSVSPLPTTKPPAKTADTIFLEIFNAVRSGRFELPAMPQIGIQFRDLVKNQADLDQVAQLLKQDMVLTAKLIQVANSAIYRGYGTVKTVEQAVGRLGLTETERMVSALTNRQLFSTEQPKYRDVLQQLWQHSLASAYAAEILAKSLARELDIDPFCAGLFHDIGALALLNIVSQMESRGRYNDDVDAAALSETIVSYHAMFGAKLLEMWDFDVGYIRTTLSHNSLYTAESLTDELLIVHFANLVAKSLGFAADGRPFETELIDTPSAKELKLEAPQIAVLTSKVGERMAQLTGLLT